MATAVRTQAPSSRTQRPAPAALEVDSAVVTRRQIGGSRHADPTAAAPIVVAGTVPSLDAITSRSPAVTKASVNSVAHRASVPPALRVASLASSLTRSTPLSTGGTSFADPNSPYLAAMSTRASASPTPVSSQHWRSAVSSVRTSTTSSSRDSVEWMMSRMSSALRGSAIDADALLAPDDLMTDLSPLPRATSALGESAGSSPLSALTSYVAFKHALRTSSAATASGADGHATAAATGSDGEAPMMDARGLINGSNTATADDDDDELSAVFQQGKVNRHNAIPKADDETVQKQHATEPSDAPVAPSPESTVDEVDVTSDDACSVTDDDDEAEQPCNASSVSSSSSDESSSPGVALPNDVVAPLSTLRAHYEVRPLHLRLRAQSTTFSMTSDSKMTSTDRESSTWDRYEQAQWLRLETTERQLARRWCQKENDVHIVQLEEERRAALEQRIELESFAFNRRYEAMRRNHPTR